MYKRQVLLCFFSSMLITNDVALITFVPFAIGVLGLTGQQELLIPVVVLQTVDVYKRQPSYRTTPTPRLSAFGSSIARRCPGEFTQFFTAVLATSSAVTLVNTVKLQLNP